jgi:hypothetical protein
VFADVGSAGWVKFRSIFCDASFGLGMAGVVGVVRALFMAVPEYARRKLARAGLVRMLLGMMEK